jgi:hypothetical protein
MTEVTLRCSFCGKSNSEVAKLIAGPSVLICDECVYLCARIVTDQVERTTTVGTTVEAIPALMDDPVVMSRFPGRPDYLGYSSEEIIDMASKLVLAWSLSAAELGSMVEALKKLGVDAPELRAALPPGPAEAFDRFIAASAGSAA